MKNLDGNFFYVTKITL